MLICSQESDGGMWGMLEPHVIQNHKVSHRKFFIQATGRIGDLGINQNRHKHDLMSCHTNDCVYTQTLHKSDRECNALN